MRDARPGKACGTDPKRLGWPSRTSTALAGAHWPQGKFQLSAQNVLEGRLVSGEQRLTKPPLSNCPRANWMRLGLIHAR